MIDGTTVIDFHGHPGRWGAGVASPETVIPVMDAAGVDRSVLFNIWHPEGIGANDDTAQLVAAAPDRFMGFAYVSPLMPDGMVAELERAVDELGPGVRRACSQPPDGIVPFQGKPKWINS